MKHLLSGLLSALLAGAMLLPAAAQNADITVVVNGQTMNFPQPPIEQAGRVFVPLRGIFEQLGASVVYQNGTINASGDGRNVSLKIGSDQAIVNGRTVAISSPPFVDNSTTLVPLRFVATALGASVDWNNNTSTVTITGGGNGHAANYNPPPQQPMNANAYVVQREPLGRASGPRPEISGQFAVAVRRDSIRITLDGRDVTNAAFVSAHGFQWTPGHPLDPGRHRVDVSGTTRDGANFTTGWDFRVSP